MQLNPYLNFNGDCAEAFRFYAEVLGGTINMMQTHGDSPMKDQTPAEWRDKVLHVEMSVGGELLMGSDAPPSHYAKPQGFSVSLNLKSNADGERIFNALAKDGKVTMAYQKTFWAAGFGMATDRFGTPWIVNCQQG